MSSRESSTGYSDPRDASSNYSTIINQNTFRAYKSKDHKGERIERENARGQNSVTYNHHARGFDQNAPSPSYGDSKAYRRTN
ncbi:hypothetical protein F4802DRAFT_336620 [Xylaria palmicola]|nr:hypothetical protein F4802DRAFT_336620 [Xylaria palmicola]